MLLIHWDAWMALEVALHSSGKVGKVTGAFACCATQASGIAVASASLAKALVAPRRT
jgi:hypothetical protein